MNVVLYTQDLEPITVADIPVDAIRFAQKRGRLVLAIQEPLNLEAWSHAPQYPLLRTVGVEFVPVRCRDKEGWLALVDDETNALAIAPGWLPGQQSMVNQHNKVCRMLVDALTHALRGPSP